MGNANSSKKEKLATVGTLAFVGLFIVDCNRMKDPENRDKNIIPVVSSATDIGKLGVTAVNHAWESWKDRESQKDQDPESIDISK